MSPIIQQKVISELNYDQIYSLKDDMNDISCHRKKNQFNVKLNYCSNHNPARFFSVKNANFSKFISPRQVSHFGDL